MFFPLRPVHFEAPSCIALLWPHLPACSAGASPCLSLRWPHLPACSAGASPCLALLWPHLPACSAGASPRLALLWPHLPAYSASSVLLNAAHSRLPRVMPHVWSSFGQTIRELHTNVVVFHPHYNHNDAHNDNIVLLNAPIHNL